MDISNVADDIRTIEQGQADGTPADAYLEQEHTAEEEAANRAAAELQERKRRRRKRNRILGIAAVILIAAGIFGYRKYQEHQAALAEAEADVLALEDGEELIYGEITQVIGNDITVAVVVEDTSASEDVNAKSSADRTEASSDSGANISDVQNGSADASGDMPDGANGAGMPDGASAGSDNAGMSGEAPAGTDRADASAGVPDGAPVGSNGAGADSVDAPGGAGNAGSMPGGMPSGAGGAGGAPAGMSRTTYKETGETREYEIPVGTDVTTMLGATTTFAKLKTGNVIGIVTESGTDNILRIKIVQ